MRQSWWYRIAFVLLFFLSLFGFGAYVFLTNPDPQALRGCLTTTMAQIELCPSRRETYTPLNQIAPVLRQAVILSEDGAFFSHQGFDWFELRKSLEKNLRTGQYRRGGSTITQQLAKNVFLSKDKTLMRKLREAILTYQIEEIFSKNEILERYLNVVEFGRDVYGIQAAARHYFQKTPAEIGSLEAAFLAFLLPNPPRYEQSFRQKKLTPFARSRVRTIIRLLWASGHLPAPAAQAALDGVDSFPWTDGATWASMTANAPESESTDDLTELEDFSEAEMVDEFSEPSELSE